MAPVKRIVDQTCMDCGRTIAAGTYLAESSLGPVHYGNCPDPLYGYPHVAPEVQGSMQAYRYLFDLSRVSAVPDPLERAVNDHEVPITELVAIAEACA